MANLPTHGDLNIAIARLQTSFESEFRHLNERIGAVEKTQVRLVEVATQGKTGLRVLLWVGGGIAAVAAATIAVWDKISG